MKGEKKRKRKKDSGTTGVFSERATGQRMMFLGGGIAAGGLSFAQMGFLDSATLATS